jgi:NDP-4-keto-2,6-dideoxyhexose 3-C-methyltransferase
MYKQITSCRICGNTHLEEIFNLGEQMLTGVFPSGIDKNAATTGPLTLVKCFGTSENCGLVQLRHSYELTEMYGMNYGYRSGLNKSMVSHLHSKVDRIRSMVNLNPGDLIIDIGSNDGTTLAAYPKELKLVGVDPTGEKFLNFYLKHIKLIPEFFSAQLIENEFPKEKAKVITSFSMFYDLENPIKFMQEIFNILHDDGIWVFEQSYLPAMIDTNSYDTICHEHLEYYCLKQIQFMAQKVGFQIVDVEFNEINGGSFSISARKTKTPDILSPQVMQILENEKTLGYDSLQPFLEFSKRINKAKKELQDFIKITKEKGMLVAGLGASTKGNVLLQSCQFNSSDLSYIGEVNSEKFGKYTPGTWIPIISEAELLKMKPDYLLVLPWHFRSFFERNPNFKDIKLIFPLPELEIIN